jgi:hypothetical protein
MRRLAVLLILSFTIAFDAGLSWAHDGSNASALKATAAPELTRGLAGLTSRLLDLQAKHERAADLSSKTSTLRELIAIAAARQQRLAALVQDHPAEVIRAALSPRVRATLPPEVAKHVEDDVTLEGELDVLHEDYAVGGRYVHWLKTPAGRLLISFAGAAPSLSTGDRVRVRALRVLHALAVGGPGQLSVLAVAPTSGTFGPQKTAVILVSFSNQPGVASTTAAQAREVMFGATGSASEFFLEASYQQTWLTGDVMGPFTIPINGASGCDYFGIARAAESAATAAGFNLSTYTRRVYAFPSNGCGWWGLGTVGGYPSMAWVNGSFQTGVVAHEMGHNLGLYHSHALECGNVTLASSCTNVEYGDVLDAMGSAVPPRHFNAAQKERLGWLGYGSSPPITTVQTSGVYAIDPYESMGTSPKAIKVKSATGDWYYVELRQPIGFDASFIGNNPNVKNGVVVHLMENGDANGIYLLDMTPATSAWSDPALGVGQTFADAAGGITIRPQWVGPDGAGVEITVGPVSCVRQAPTLAISPASQQAAPGNAATYTLTVTNRDIGCAPSTFNPSASVPGGWTGNFGSTGLSIAAGGTASTTLTVQSSPSASPAAYTVGATIRNAADASVTASASATYTVSGTACTRRNPSVTVSPAAQQGAPGSTVSYTVTVANNDTGCPAASFSQSATVPSGWTASFGATSMTIAAGSSASTFLSVKAPAAAAVGTYAIAPRARNAASPAHEGVGAATFRIPAACVRKAPTVAVSPAAQEGAPGASLAYAVSITNNDTGCIAATFSQNVTMPSGWTGGFVNGSVSLSPGATASVTLNVKPATSAKPGNYTIVPRSTHPAAGFTSSATATYAVTTAGGGGGGATSFADDFTRADSDTIGNGWTEMSGELAIEANELRSGPTRGLHVAVRTSMAGSKQAVAASFSSTDNNVSPRFGLIARYRDPNNYYACYRLAGGSSVVRIVKVVNGVEVVLKWASIANPIKGTTFSLSCHVDGTKIDLGVGGVTKLTAVDSSFSHGNVGLFMGSAGLPGSAGPSHRADGFTASVQ